MVAGGCWSCTILGPCESQDAEVFGLKLLDKLAEPTTRTLQTCNHPEVDRIWVYKEYIRVISKSIFYLHLWDMM